VAESVMRSISTPILVLHPNGAPLQAPRGERGPAVTGYASGWMSAGRIES
jgi:hypothetical protein